MFCPVKNFMYVWLYVLYGYVVSKSFAGFASLDVVCNEHYACALNVGL